MKELAGRLTALDPDAGAAVRVIAYFDRLAESRAGVEALVRGAAVLAGCPARLVDPERRVHMRVEADGTRRDGEAAPDPAWPCARLSPDSAAVLWLERGAGEAEPRGTAANGLDAEYARAVPETADAQHVAVAPSVVDAVILERAAGAVRLVLDRTRGRAPADDPALVETLLDATAPEQARLHAARRLGLDLAAHARALAPLNGRPRVVPADAGPVPQTGHPSAEGNGRPGRGLTSPAAGAVSDPRGGAGVLPPAARPATPVPNAARPGAGSTASSAGLHPTPTRLDPPSEGPHRTPAGSRFPAGRLGVGPAVPVLELPRSWDGARTALRFTAEGTPQDPGPSVVHADELGGIALLARLVAPGSEPPEDVRALETAAATAPWLPATLHAVASTSSLRAAAAEINVHHSTLQDRLSQAEHLLGWPVRTPQGRLRLQLALTMRRLARP
ncbi:helix-turn-helix domain-containing protein [Streptomyces sp. NPDC126510]|uniref:helix-turn-helix domain-containing protein n=1 Tax=Streptomyces sp. NPDC126510 TaxID=3155317 RepID=UPI00331ADA61